MKMPKKLIVALLITTTTLLSCQSPSEQLHIEIIPKPTELHRLDGFFNMSENTTLFVDEDLKTITNYFVNEIEESTNLSLKQVKNPKTSNCIIILKSSELPSENYWLNISGNHIKIEASDHAGVVYALQTLKQLITINNLSGNSSFHVPGLKIIDGPAFAWRGYMLDVSRHFHPVEDIKKVLDFMAGLKLNRFHWHLTDDQGFRLEMKKYPKLNEIGSWRMDYNSTDENINAYWGRPVQKEGEVPSYGGFYTREQVKELIAYAKERNIEILPEIDVPGHAQAIIASYPELACEKKKYYVATGAVRANNTLCPSNAMTYQFLEAVIEEVAELFPFEYIHIGGDECNKTNWENHKQCQNFIRKNKLKDEHELQSYFVRKIEKIVNAKGKKLIGWDEILEGGLAPNATVMSWRGEKGGIKSAQMKHDVIMSPSNYNYLDFKQGQSDFEPNLGYAQTLLSKCYNYRVIPEVLSQEESKHILGTQANLWSESISDWGKLTYMTFPRLFAVAENAWTPENQQNWDDFIERLKPQLKVLEKDGFRFAKSAFNPWLHHQGNGKSIKVWFSSELTNPEIRYTLDGSNPSHLSTLFSDTIIIDKTATLKAAIFENSEQLGNIIEKTFIVHKAAGAQVKILSGKNEDTNESALTDLSYGQLLQRGDTHWQRFNNDVELEIFFDHPTDINSVTINSMRHTLSHLYAASEIEVFAKKNDVYEKIGDSGYLGENITQGRNILSNTVDCKAQKVTSIKVVVKKFQDIPEGHVNAGRQAFMKIDEVVVL